ncbi:meiotic nuclear division protein 1 [Gigaspora rosea]|uniref:Meiotic nuclear division protein 1 n=1 Tax=Gigaspora rosea TaxID=44941 RepID=A0A397UMB6_9GLOM|nr:meiotic nuclear division protein 1 [Gigaspora rosea]
MSTKKLSAAEKRKRLEALFHETKSFYQLKELERLAPKKKGIVAQSVKDVLQDLVNDNLVSQDKIGTSNYFWSFPSSALQSRKIKIEELHEEINKLKEKIADQQANIEKASGGREDSAERASLLKTLAEAEALNKRNEEELKRYRECDPVTLNDKEKYAKLYLEGANRWTDNIFILQSYCANKYNVERADFNRQFEIPDDFDTLE